MSRWDDIKKRADEARKKQIAARKRIAEDQRRSLELREKYAKTSALEKAKRNVEKLKIAVTFGVFAVGIVVMTTAKKAAGGLWNWIHQRKKVRYTDGSLKKNVIEGKAADSSEAHEPRPVNREKRVLGAGLAGAAIIGERVSTRATDGDPSHDEVSASETPKASEAEMGVSEKKTTEIPKDTVRNAAIREAVGDVTEKADTAVQEAEKKKDKTSQETRVADSSSAAVLAEMKSSSSPAANEEKIADVKETKHYKPDVASEKDSREKLEAYDALKLSEKLVKRLSPAEREQIRAHAATDRAFTAQLLKEKMGIDVDARDVYLDDLWSEMRRKLEEQNDGGGSSAGVASGGFADVVSASERDTAPTSAGGSSGESVARSEMSRSNGVEGSGGKHTGERSPGVRAVDLAGKDARHGAPVPVDERIIRGHADNDGYTAKEPAVAAQEDIRRRHLGGKTHRSPDPGDGLAERASEFPANTIRVDKTGDQAVHSIDNILENEDIGVKEYGYMRRDKAAEKDGASNQGSATAEGAAVRGTGPQSSDAGTTSMSGNNLDAVRRTANGKPEELNITDTSVPLSENSRGGPVVPAPHPLDILWPRSRMRGENRPRLSHGARRLLRAIDTDFGESLANVSERKVDATDVGVLNALRTVMLLAAANGVAVGDLWPDVREINETHDILGEDTDASGATNPMSITDNSDATTFRIPGTVDSELLLQYVAAVICLNAMRVLR